MDVRELSTDQLETELRAVESDWRRRFSGHSLDGAQRLVTRHRRYGRRQERADHRGSYATMQPSLDESWWDMRAGMAGLAGKIVAETLSSRAEQMGPEAGSMWHRQALALEELCVGDNNSDNSGGGGSGPSFEVTGFFDIDAPAPDVAGAELEWGPRIGPDALGEFLCAGKVRLVGTQHGKPVVTSAASRQIPPAVRAFVTRRDGGCRAPGCTSKRRLQPHHVIPRSHRGTHEPSNLITLCWFHHHIVVHRRGMTIERQPDGSIRFKTPADARAPP